MSTRNRTVLIGLAIAITACGGGSLGGVDIFGPRPPSLPETNAGGIWEGSLFDDESGLTLAIVGVITETGENTQFELREGRFVSEQGVHFILTSPGSFSTNISFSSNITAIAPTGTMFSDGSTVANGIVTGTVVERSTLDGDWSLNGEAMTGTIAMTYNADYERDSSQVKIAGDWMDSLGTIFSIDGVGVLFAQDPSGCIYNGSVSVIYSSFNVYRLRSSVANCANADVDGEYLGLGVLLDDVGVDDAFVVQLDNGQVAFGDTLLKQ